ncbi:hypothetical protein JW906_04470 [bacterium]|nr:hypothetical protein [bacterium]
MSKRMKGFCAAGWIPCLLLVAGCEGLLPDEFRDKSGYALSGPDETACRLLSADTTLAPAPNFIAVEGAVLDSAALQAWAGSPADSILALLDTLAEDTLVLVSNPAAAKTVYALFPQSGAASGLLFFLTWDMDAGNVNATLELSLYDAAGRRVPVKGTAMPVETAAGCTQALEVGGQDMVLPSIRARYGFRLEPGVYLAAFAVSDPSAVGTFRLAVLHGE